jgi:hypothetical protein
MTVPTMDVRESAAKIITASFTEAKKFQTLSIIVSFFSTKDSLAEF